MQKYSIFRTTLIMLIILFPWNGFAQDSEEQEEFDYQKDIEYELFLRPGYEFKTGYHIVGEWYQSFIAKRLIGSVGVRVKKQFFDCTLLIGLGDFSDDEKDGFVGRLGGEILLGSETNSIFSRTQFFFGGVDFFEQKFLLTRGMGSYLYSAVGLDIEKILSEELLYAPLFFGGIRIKDVFRFQGGVAYEEEEFHGKAEFLFQYSFGKGKKTETPE